MMQRSRCKDECHEPNKHMSKTRKPWKASEAPVLGRHNTPPLWEDLVPRSRMARERNGREKEEVKLSWFFEKRVKPRILRGWTIERKNATKKNKVESTPGGKSSKEEQIRAALRLKSDVKLYKMKITWAEGTTPRLEMEGKDYELDKQDDGLMRATTQCLRNRWKNGIKGMEEKTTSSASNELEKASLGEGSTKLLENQQRKE